MPKEVQLGATRVDRIGVIGDVHAEDELLKRALMWLKGESVDGMVCTGDIADGPGSVDQCCETLSKEGVVTVRGNHDRWLLQHTMRDLPSATVADRVSASTLDFLDSLPVTVEFETAAGPALLCHGLSTNDMGYLGPDDYGYALEANDDLQRLIREGRYRYVISGHVHRKMVRTFGGVTVINAGTLLREHDPTFLLLDFVEGAAQYCEFEPDGTVRRAARLPLTGLR